MAEDSQSLERGFTTPNARQNIQPLGDVLILDLSHVLSGPFATMTLADMGATVIKVEKPGRGDTTRGTPPHMEGMSHYFGALNRNKYGVAVDLKSEEGKEILQELVRKCDVLLHNFRPGVMEKLGLGYDELSADNPGLVYCAISGFGQDGPLRLKTAFDAVAQAMSGLMSLTGAPDGPPMRAGVSMGDYVPGLYAVNAVIAALRVRDRTGCGQFLDVSMFDCLFNLMAYYVPYYQISGEEPPRTGGAHPTVVPMGAFPTSDGYLVVAAFNQGFWRNLCRALDREVWIDDDRYRSLSLRAKNAAALSTEIEAALQTKSTDEWVDIMEAHDVPCGPILSIAELINHEQVNARRLLEPLGRGDISAPIRPVKFSSFETEVRLSPPDLGADTIEVLASMGVIDAEDLTAIEDLIQRGVIGVPREGGDAE